MNLATAIGSRISRKWARRAVPWSGGLFIGAIIGLAGYDIVRSYYTTVSNTGRELETQARVIAEQTARSLQAVDVVLRHVVEQFRVGTLSALSRPDLRSYLQEQAVGLIQIDGLLALHADGTVRGTSYASPEQEAALNVAAFPPFVALRSNRHPGLFIGDARQGSTDR